MGPKTLAKRLRGRHDEDGAEMIEFAIVVVLLITLVYGMVAIGLSLAARESINQAAADGARAGIVLPMATTSQTDTAETSADNQAIGELGWLGIGSSCSSSNIVCKNDASSVTSCPSTHSSSSGEMCVSATTALCTGSTQTCLSVAVNYYYTSAPIFPLAPGLNLITPSDISSTSTMETSTPT
ncbi:MAG TPA: TadE/TadG family type IV pilus assembly protein [Acidimicrobiales bacterium]|jgi:Flp pilus assembly protein TadG